MPSNKPDTFVAGLRPFKQPQFPYTSGTLTCFFFMKGSEVKVQLNIYVYGSSLNIERFSSRVMGSTVGKMFF